MTDGWNAALAARFGAEAKLEVDLRSQICSSLTQRFGSRNLLFLLCLLLVA
jgi:hypothetical protein